MWRIALIATMCVLSLGRCVRSAAAEFPAEAAAIERIKTTVAKVEANRAARDGRVVDVTLYGAKDDVFPQLQRFGHLRQLNILDSPCLKGLGFEYLRDLDHLEILVINNAGIIDEGVFRMASIDTLRDLVLAETRITSLALPALGRIHGLVGLDLSSNPCIRSGGFAPLANLEQLEQLMLHGLNFRDPDLESLGKMRSLTVLDLSDTKVGDEGLLYVEAMGRKKDDFWVYLDGTSVTPEGGGRLEKWLPKAFIVHDSAATIRERGQREKTAGSKFPETDGMRRLFTRAGCRVYEVHRTGRNSRGSLGRLVYFVHPTSSCDSVSQPLFGMRPTRHETHNSVHGK